ncbi:hypothetical protein EJB05_40848 [Eragrostis curvula]|uniref:DUF7895 domain-containing protein n=1 Tax=Eragrostis curvula TaxID=38414 RepID=A0A5J9T852_9POAL|nr:hypothetical protein EJB05_40848 [Eragrostis curvula]
MMPLASSSSSSLAACSSAHSPPRQPFSGGASAANTCPFLKQTCVSKDAKSKHRLVAWPPSALPDPQAAAAVSVLVAGVAATLLLRSSSSSSSQQRQQTETKEEEEEEEAGEECWDCGGTGLCSRCKGEGFVFKQLAEDTATKARKAAKNMATRYTAGLPTKWTYCNKCSSSRSCTTCRGSGRIASLTSTNPQ